MASEDSGEAPVALQMAPARTPVLSLSNQNKHETIKMSAHALPAEHRAEARSGAGSAGRMARGMQMKRIRPSVLLQLLLHWKEIITQ